MRYMMMSFTLSTAFLLCSLSWISASGSGFWTVDVKPGDNVTLQCSNISGNSTHTIWSRIVNTTKICSISSTSKHDRDALLCEGFQKGKFDMSSNISSFFLKITQVNVSDSGLYLCGFSTIKGTVMDVVHLKVEASNESHGDTEGDRREKSAEITKLASMVLAALTVVLVMVIIGLLVKIRKLQTARNEDPQRQNLDSDDLNYAALSFHPPTRRNHRPASEPEPEPEPNVVYAATR